MFAIVFLLALQCCMDLGSGFLALVCTVLFQQRDANDTALQ